MRIIDRYIVKSILFIFAASLFIFCLLYVLIDSTSNLDEFIAQSVMLKTLLQYYLWSLPVIVVQLAPMAALIAVLFTYSNLNSHNEIIVLRSSGMNFWRIAKPALWAALLVSALVFFLNERFVPQAETQTRKIKNENIVLEVDRKKKKKAKIKYLTYYGQKNRLYCIDSFDPNTFELQGVTVHEYDDKLNLKEKTVALNGKWTGIAWKFYQCHVSTFAESIQGDTRVKVYEEKLMDIKESPTDFLKQSLNVNSMNIRQLYDYIKRFSRSGAFRALNNLKVDLYEKTSKPFSAFVVVLLGLPLCLMTARRKAQTFASLAIAVMVGFFYFVCNAVGLAFGKGQFLPPWLAAWLAPMIFAAVALIVIKRKF